MQKFIRDINMLSAFLAQRDLAYLTPQDLQAATGAPQVDLLIVLGGIIPYGCAVAAQAFAAGIARHAILAGGVGHTTPYFRTQVAQHLPQCPVADKSEAELLHALFCAQDGVDAQRVFCESASTNCGENARFALRVAQENGLPIGTVLLMHDSTMQRRIDATCRKLWPAETRFFNYASYVPELCMAADGTLAFAGPPLWGMWTVEHFARLALGEVARLHDTPDGYGPLGKNFMAHVDVPNEVLAAFARVKAAKPDWVRTATPSEPALAAQT